MTQTNNCLQWGTYLKCTLNPDSNLTNKKIVGTQISPSLATIENKQLNASLPFLL